MCPFQQYPIQRMCKVSQVLLLISHIYLCFGYIYISCILMIVRNTSRWACFAHSPATCDSDVFHYITAYIHNMHACNCQQGRSCKPVEVIVYNSRAGHQLCKQQTQGAAFQNCDACACTFTTSRLSTWAN